MSENNEMKTQEISPYSDITFKQKKTETRCSKIIIKTGCQCQIKKKDGYEFCYSHLPKAERDNYDTIRLKALGRSEEDIMEYLEARRQKRNTVSRVSARKCRAINANIQ